MKALTVNKFSLRGLVGVPYEDRLKDRKWSAYFGQYQNQRWARWDTYSCWMLSTINSIETQCEFLWKEGLFNKEAMDFFTLNGYIDTDGDFSFSERFSEIMSGIRDAGGSAPLAYSIVSKYGLYPRAKLNYTIDKSNNFYTQEEFNNDYFDPAVVTDEMKALAKQSLKYLGFAFQQVGNLWTTPNTWLLKTKLYQAPLLLSIPVPEDGSWNQVQITCNLRQPVHLVECYEVVAGTDFPYKIYDQYEPHLKELAKDYYLAMVHQIVVTAKIPVVKNAVPSPLTLRERFWTSLNEWWDSIFARPYLGI